MPELVDAATDQLHCMLVGERAVAVNAPEAETLPSA